MHAILKGLAKQFMNYWFRSEFSTYVFNIRIFVSEIDKRLLRMKPPHAFRRSPRSIKSLSFWKAAEFRAWFLYYSIAALKDFLPQDYLIPGLFWFVQCTFYGIHQYPAKIQKE